jgi:hypothetical protein
MTISLFSMSIITFEKSPVDALAIHLGLSPDAAENAYAAQCAARAQGKDYEIDGHQYRAASRIDAQMQHQDWSNVLAPLWAVVELI